MVCLMHELITSNTVYTVLSIGFAGQTDKHREKCTVMKTFTGEIHIKI